MINPSSKLMNISIVKCISQTKKPNATKQYL